MLAGVAGCNRYPVRSARLGFPLLRELWGQGRYDLAVALEVFQSLEIDPFDVAANAALRKR
jgi:hypothetical protein